MADAPFLTPEDGRQRPEHQWSPPQHPDVTLYTPEQVPEDERAGAVTLDAPMPVWVTVEYAEIGSLRTQGSRSPRPRRLCWWRRRGRAACRPCGCLARS